MINRQRKYQKLLVLFLLFILGSVHGFACTGISVNFKLTNNGGCIPQSITIDNNSTGARASTALYQLYVNDVLQDTAHGLSKTFNVNLYRGTHKIKLRSIDTSGCIDSSQSNITITKNRVEFTGSTTGYSTTPEWINCIQQITDPDSFYVQTKSKDSLRSLQIIWGDGNSQSFSPFPKDSTIEHLINKTGTFTTLLITTDTAGCVDTTYGSIINERIPTAGIIGPNSGFNVGCSPYTIKFVNNSSNISNGTVFEWDFGDGFTSNQDNSTFNQAFNHTYVGNLCNGTVTLVAKNGCGYSQTTWNPIQISEKDKALFSIDSGNCDRTGSFTFRNNSTDSFCLFPDTKSYKWIFGDGDTTAWMSSKAPVTHNYTDEGNKSVCLIARNKCGDDTACLPITVVYTPIAGFIHDTLKGCGSVTVHVEDTSVGYGLQRLWQWGDGTTSNQRKDTHQYTGKGTYNLKLSVWNRCGTRTMTKTVVIKDKPTAGFTGVIDGCAVHQLNLTNNTSTDFDSSVIYRWDFGNGDTSILKTPPTISYTDSGSYPIQLIVSDTCGMDTQSQIVRVDRYPSISITADSALCSLDTVAFSNNSSDYDVILVDYGDGTTRDSIFSNGGFEHVYTTSGQYQVTFRAINRQICEARDTLTVIIKPNSLAAFTVNDTAACAPFTFQITNESKFASSYSWSINDTFYSSSKEIDSIVIATDSVLKYVQLIALDTIGCRSDTFGQLLLTGKNPIARITNPIDSGCGPLTDTLLNGSEFAEFYQWQLGNNSSTSNTDAATVYPPNSSGDTTYQIRLISTTWLGCVDTTYGSRTVYPIPNAQFAIDTNNGCYPLVVNFTNQSDPNGMGQLSELKYSWDLGNGLTDTVISPQNILYYASETIDSIYTVQLTVMSPNSCDATISKPITVYPDPTVDFDFSKSDGCGPLSVTLQNKSVPNNKGSINVMTFVWNLGEGNSSTQVSPQTTYFSSATKDTFYTAKLIGTSEHQCVDSIEKQIQVYPKPVADFAVDTNAGCSPLQINFTNLSYPKDTSAIDDMTFDWRFNNGNTSTAKNNTQQFIESAFTDKTYTITLIALSEHQCRDTFRDTVTVHPTPNAKFSPSTNQGCGPLYVDFINQSQLNDTNFWNLGNGFSYSPEDTNSTFNFQLLKDTVYAVNLWTKSKNGCTSDTTTQYITVWSQPIAAFTLDDDSICHYDTTITTNNSQGATSYKWTFGDGFSSTQTNPTHRYAKSSDPLNALNFDIELIAITNKGCRDTTTDVEHIHPYTITKIGNTLDSFCSPATIQFVNSSTNYDTSFWNLDEGTTTYQNQPSKFYENISNTAKNIVVSLQTTTKFGCTDYDTIRFRILPEPIADFSPFRLDICDSGYHTMVDRSINAAEYFWDFGDGSTSTAVQPYHLLERNRNNTANYTIQLIVKNESGCPDTATRSVSLNPFVTVDFDTSLIRGVCVGDEIDFLNRSKFAKYHKWVFGDGGESVDSLPTYFYAQPGLYTVKYVGYDLHGCPDSISITNMVEVHERPKAGFTFSPTSPKMPNSLVQFNNTSTPVNGLTYRWDFDENGATSTAKDPSHTYADSGTYDVVLIVSNAFCSDTTNEPIFIAPPYPTISFTTQDTAGCGPFEVQFTNNTRDASRYRWSFDDGTESTEENPKHTFYIEGFYDINLVAYGPGGQKDTTYRRMVHVYDKPTAYFTITNKTKYLPNPVFYPRNESVDAVAYVWNLWNDQDITIQTSTDTFPQFTINQVGQFGVELQAINAFGCRDTFSRPLYITVLDSGFIFVPTAFSPTKSEGLNDVFRPTMGGVSPEGYQFQVFNRWGEKLFETNKIGDSWDGTYEGEDCEMEQYIFVVSGAFYSGQIFDEKGTIFLMR